MFSGFVGEAKNYDGWFGFLGVLLVVAAATATAFFSFYQLKRAGRQKIAEARLDWSDQYRELAVELYGLLVELERLMAPGKPPSIRRRRLQLEARSIAANLLMMVNPESSDAAASDEYAVEADLGSRLAKVGVSLDMDYVRRHRKVLKHNWYRIKTEF
ncbi:hypothetical protein FY145_24565 [Agrobacterium tumefaciens]|uniref:Uncharacterized protein n=1 Tax=Agrobacterium tumefaciens TaxID=358 RepID=A0AAP9J8S9_AGRTU|nr:hypothetical protein [Agrobacterium tumefaciens]NSY04420.1 hypothetical protein [Agrobacterium tumefaciens]NSZ61009.1 hypothetical protein [Agrobacterium tumefaciens]OVE87199.1 hypothetical protein B7W89_24535 [Agrobacterium tumefaciens]QDY97337.1 hypothetical protein CG010_025040 [Agrobacterium tumefaciens]UXS47587.1 hypothetical protein FY149_10270 [Agrobacterium tumefaciens]